MTMDESPKSRITVVYRGGDEAKIYCDAKGCQGVLVLPYDHVRGGVEQKRLKDLISSVGWAVAGGREGDRTLVYCRDHGPPFRSESPDGRPTALDSGVPPKAAQATGDLTEGSAFRSAVRAMGHWPTGSLRCDQDAAQGPPAGPPPTLKEALSKLGETDRLPFEPGEPCDLAQTLLKLAARHLPPAGQLHLASALADELECTRGELSRAGFPTSKEATQALTAIRAELDRRIDLLPPEDPGPL